MDPIPAISWREFVLWLLRRRRRVRVNGRSMLPTLQPGDEVLVNPHAYRRRSIQPGDVVVTRHPFRTDVRSIKRVHAVLPDGRCEVRGDNPAESTDSRAYGTLAPNHVQGRVTCRFA